MRLAIAALPCGHSEARRRSDRAGCGFRDPRSMVTGFVRSDVCSRAEAPTPRDAQARMPPRRAAVVARQGGEQKQKQSPPACWACAQGHPSPVASRAPPCGGEADVLVAERLRGRGGGGRRGGLALCLMGGQSEWSSRVMVKRCRRQEASRLLVKPPSTAPSAASFGAFDLRLRESLAPWKPENSLRRVALCSGEVAFSRFGRLSRNRRLLVRMLGHMGLRPDQAALEAIFLRFCRPPENGQFLF